MNLKDHRGHFNKKFCTLQGYDFNAIFNISLKTITFYELLLGYLWVSCIVQLIQREFISVGIS